MCDEGRPGAFKGFKELHRSTSAFVDTISSRQAAAGESHLSTAHQTKIASPAAFAALNVYYIHTGKVGDRV